MALNADYFIKMPIHQKLLILAALVALLFLGYYFLIDSKLTEEYKRKQGQLSSKRSELAKLETVERDKEKLDRQLKEKQRKLEKAKEKLPTETEMEKLFITISELGQKNGIKFSNFKPQTERAHGNLYIEVPISLDFTGSYVYVMNFFYKATHLPRIVNFHGLGISSGKKGNEISVKCTAVTYKFKE